MDNHPGDHRSPRMKKEDCQLSFSIGIYFFLIYGTMSGHYQAQPSEIGLLCENWFARGIEPLFLLDLEIP